MRFSSGDASVEVDLAHGGRLASFVVRGHELLITDPSRPVLEWGCYPMAPFAGRVRNGVFTFDGRRYELPCNLPPHAIHGVVFDAAWTDDGDGVLSTPLRPPWPFPGRVVQRVSLEPTRLTLTLEVHADDEAMPASCGWHPWWRRPVEVTFEAEAMFVRDATKIPTGEVVSPPPPGPWDDCFTELNGPPVLRFGDGGPTVRIDSTCGYLVVFDEPPDAVCVEPQTAPPDALNDVPAVVVPGRPLVASVTFRWG